MSQAHLFPRIRQQVKTQLSEYVQHANLTVDIDNYIVPPGLGQNAGLMGALALAKNALR
ncbi:putative fructokinase [compost metagenome]